MNARWIGKIGRPLDPAGIRTTGRIVRLLVGQGHGYIRGLRGREIFFHRADVREGTAFNALEVGDPVTFDLIDDAISGARATRVTRGRVAR